MIESINGKIILEPYGNKKGLVSAGENTGFSVVKQRTNLIGLKVLMPCTVRSPNGTKLCTLSKGDIVYYTEEVLYTHPWSSKLMECPDIEEKFIIGETSLIVAFENRCDV